MEKSEYIKLKLKEIISQINLSQIQIAECLGVSQSCIAHYVKGDIVPSLDTFAKLCEVLDVDANYVLGITK